MVSPLYASADDISTHKQRDNIFRNKYTDKLFVCCHKSYELVAHGVNVEAFRERSRHICCTCREHVRSSCKNKEWELPYSMAALEPNSFAQVLSPFMTDTKVRFDEFLWAIMTFKWLITGMYTFLMHLQIRHKGLSTKSTKMILRPCLWLRIPAFLFLAPCDGAYEKAKFFFEWTASDTWSTKIPWRLREDSRA